MSSPYGTLTYVGKWKGRRIDGAQKVAGQMKLGADANFPDQLYMKIKHSAIPSGTITAMDTTAAAAIPGVVAILTPFDIKNNTAWAAIKYGNVYALPYDKIRCTGEEIAAVVAEDPYVAEQACQAIKVTYSPTPFVLHPLTGKSTTAPVVYDGTGGSLSTANLGAATVYSIGNADSVLASLPTGAQVMNGTYEASHWQQNNVCSWAFTVKVDTTGRTELWSANQYPRTFAYAIAGWLGVARSRVKCYSESGDGGFGDKLSWKRPHILGTLLAQKTGRPVKYVSTREDNLVNGNHRAKVYFQTQTAYQSDGTILALEATIYGATGFAGAGATSGHALCLYDIYKIPNIKITTYDVFTNVYYYGAIRCVADPYASWVMGSIIDEVAMKLGMNPTAVMAKNNMYVTGDKDQLQGNRIASCGQPACYNQALTLSNYATKWKAAPSSPSGLKGVVHGIGLVNHACAHGSGSSTSTTVEMLADGSVMVHIDTPSIGQGRREEVAIVAAEQMGLPLSMIAVTNYDSDAGSDTGSAGGSTQTKRSTNATGAACVDLKNQMMAKAATSLKTTVDQLTYALDGSMKIYITSTPSSSVTFASLTGEPWLMGTGHYTAPTGTTQHVFTTCVAEVDVDTDTGLIKVTNYTQVQDVGQVIFPLGIEGQAHSGMNQAISAAIMEEQWPDTQTGNSIIISSLDHKMIIPTQMPAIANVNIGYVNDAETPPDSGTTVNGVLVPYNYGAKGCAEPWTGAGIAAIAAAFANATGTHLYQLPFTPEKVLAALGKTNAPNGQAYGYGGGN